MKFSLNWLKKYIDISSSLEHLLKKIDDIGLEVESVENQAEKYKNFVVAEILSAEQHPNADSLRVCKVNSGEEILNIVCGAKNARADIKVILAKVGAIVPNGLFEIKRSKIRSIESEGMLCSASELCLGNDSDGIVELDSNSVVGTKFSDYAGLNDVIVEVALTPNRRRDCASIYGIARDLAAAGCGTVKDINITVKSSNANPKVNVKIEAQDHCSQFNYFTSIVKDKLEVEDINLMGKVKDLHESSLVNLSNFTMLSLGNPNHIYDLSKIAGDTIYVRLSNGGEEFIALGGKSYILPEGILIICDDQKVLSVAGIMGGELSKVDENTEEVFVEVANFNQESIGRAAQLLSLYSDSKYRFEGGIDIGSLDRAIEWMRQFFPSAAKVVKVYGKECNYVTEVDLDLDLVEKFLGIKVDDKEVYEILDKSSFEPQLVSARKLHLKVPSWKQGNIENYCDIVEELLRMGVMEKINSAKVNRGFINSRQLVKNTIDTIGSNSHENIFNDRIITISSASQIRNELIGRGINEVLTWSFYSENFSLESNHVSKYYLNKESQQEELISIKNPINSNFTTMRRTLVQNLVTTLATYPNNQEKSFSIFEIGNIYSNLLNGFQSTVVSAIRAGNVFNNKKEQYGFYNVREDLLSLLSLFGMSCNIIDYSYDSLVPKYYHPKRAIRLKLGNNVIGICGELHPAIISKFEVKHKQVAAFELLTFNLPSKCYKLSQPKPLHLNQYQKIERDLAFIINEEIAVGEVVRAALSIKEKLLEGVEIFDIYHGIENGKKSVGIKLLLQPIDENLMDETINSIMNRVVEAVGSKVGGKLRG
jgi:phenylalanyl-tRNA synthetase beta chain